MSDIKKATGKELDGIAAEYGFCRGDESDDDFRRSVLKKIRDAADGTPAHIEVEITMVNGDEHTVKFTTEKQINKSFGYGSEIARHAIAALRRNQASPPQPVVVERNEINGKIYGFDERDVCVEIKDAPLTPIQEHVMSEAGARGAKAAELYVFKTKEEAAEFRKERLEPKPTEPVNEYTAFPTLAEFLS